MQYSSDGWVGTNYPSQYQFVSFGVLDPRISPVLAPALVLGCPSAVPAGALPHVLLHVVGTLRYNYTNAPPSLH